MSSQKLDETVLCRHTRNQEGILTRKRPRERKLAYRHLAEGSTVSYDVSSSSYHGRWCPLAGYGDHRGEKLPSISYGLLTDREGRPVAVDVYPGSPADTGTVPDQGEKLRSRFGWHRENGTGRQRPSSLFYQEEALPEERWQRDPVTQAVPSPSVRVKKASLKTPAGWPGHSLHTWLVVLATRCRNPCRVKEEKHPVCVQLLTEATPFHHHVFFLLGVPL